MKYLDRLKSEVKTYVLGALALVAALAWNEAFKNLFKQTQLNHGPLIYALIVTAISVAAALALVPLSAS